MNERFSMNHALWFSMKDSVLSRTFRVSGFAPAVGDEREDEGLPLYGFL